MNEQVLLDYFENRIPVDVLAADLKGSQRKTSYDTTAVFIQSLKHEGLFTVTKTHLIQLCNDTLSGKLSFEELNTIAFAVLVSEYFRYSENDELVDRVLFEWDNPEIGFPLNMENMMKWKELLESGIDSFNAEDLKRHPKQK